MTLRLDDSTIARVDALAPCYTRPWRTPSRSELLRHLILEGLDLEEKAPPGEAPAERWSTKAPGRR